jgi:hypothetical protein
LSPPRLPAGCARRGCARSATASRRDLPWRAWRPRRGAARPCEGAAAGHRTSTACSSPPAAGRTAMHRARDAGRHLDSRGFVPVDGQLRTNVRTCSRSAT